MRSIELNLGLGGTMEFQKGADELEVKPSKKTEINWYVKVKSRMYALSQVF